VSGSHAAPEGSYTVVIKGVAGPTVQRRFSDLDVTFEDGVTLLGGIQPDQAALFGVLQVVQHLGLEVLEVRQSSDAGR
jgi:hypothetical protein